MTHSLYLALGDSLTTGYGVGMHNSFASLYYDRLQAASPGLEYVNLGVNGLTSQELADMIAKRKYRKLVEGAQIITITIGSNDLIDAGRTILTGRVVNIPALMGHLQQNLLMCTSLLRSLNPNAVVKIATLYNPLLYADRQFFANTQQMISLANQALSSCSQIHHIILVPVHRAFQGKEEALLAEDYLHPNHQGHRVMAGLFASVS